MKINIKCNNFFVSIVSAVNFPACLILKWKILMNNLFKMWSGITEAALIYGASSIPFSLGGEC